MEFYKPSIIRKDMQAVLLSLAVEKFGPGEKNILFAKTLKEKEFLLFKYYNLYRSPVTAFLDAFNSLGIHEGDNIALSPFCPSFYNVLLGNLGLNCFFLDVEKERGTVKAEDVLDLAKKQDIKLFLATPSLTYLPDLKKIKASGIKIFCDLTQLIGHDIDMQSIDVAFLSLEDDALVTSAGGAGIFSSSVKFDEILRQEELCDINTSLALKQIENYNFFLKKRKEIQKVFIQAAGMTKNRIFSFHSDEEKDNSLFFSLELENYKQALSFINQKKIAVRRTFSSTIFEEMTDKSKYLNCMSLYNKVYSFPMYYYLKTEEIDLIKKVMSVLP